MNYGFVKVAAAVPHVQVADCFYNIDKIEDLMREASEKGVQIIAFPELSVTAYTCLDLFAQQTLVNGAEAALIQLINNTADLDILTIVGVPLRTENRLINAAVVFQKGVIRGVVPKTYLPNYKEFQEQRWFTSATELRESTISIGKEEYPLGSRLLFRSGRLSVGIEICEDLWVPVPPSSLLAMEGANIIFNLSASNELIGKHAYLRSLICQQSARCMAGYVYASSGFGESSTDLVFAGNGIIAENGNLLAESPRFTMEEQLVISEIDIETLQNDRQVNTSFMYGASGLLKEKAQAVDFQLRTPNGFSPHVLPVRTAHLRRRLEGTLRRDIPHTGCRPCQTPCPYTRPNGCRRYFGRPGLHIIFALALCHDLDALEDAFKHHRPHDARFRHDRPHLHQCLRPHPLSRCHPERNLDQGSLPAAFRRHRPRSVRPRRDLRKQPGTRTYPTADGYRQPEERSRHRHRRPPNSHCQGSPSATCRCTA